MKIKWPQNKRLLLGIALLILVFGGLLLNPKAPAPGESDSLTLNGITVPPVPTLNPEQVAQGKQLYATYCSACHGANLEGQPNWKQRGADGKLPAPPHDSSGHTWHHADDLLLEIIANGGDPTISTMPAFKDTLSEAEMRAVLAFIKASWGRNEREFQWWVTASSGSR